MHALERRYLKRMAANPHAQQLRRALHKDQIMNEVSEIKATDHSEDALGLVPERWVRVPVEPTEEMIRAALRSGGDMMDPRSIVIDDYRAMLAAAPKPAVIKEATTESQWTSVNDQLPKNEEHVLVKFPTMQRVGFFIREKTVSTSDRGFEGDTDYDEESDESYWPGGWYFYEDGMELWMSSMASPTHWHPLPSGPAQEQGL